MKANISTTKTQTLVIAFALFTLAACSNNIAPSSSEVTPPPSLSSMQSNAPSSVCQSEAPQNESINEHFVETEATYFPVSGRDDHKRVINARYEFAFDIPKDWRAFDRSMNAVNAETILQVLAG